MLFIRVIAYRVDTSAVNPGFKMQVRTCGVAGGADFGNFLSLRHRLALTYYKPAGVGIKGLKTVAVVNQHIIAKALLPARYKYGARLCGNNIFAV